MFSNCNRFNLIQLQILFFFCFFFRFSLFFSSASRFRMLWLFIFASFIFCIEHLLIQHSFRVYILWLGLVKPVFCLRLRVLYATLKRKWHSWKLINSNVDSIKVLYHFVKFSISSLLQAHWHTHTHTRSSLHPIRKYSAAHPYYKRFSFNAFFSVWIFIRSTLISNIRFDSRLSIECKEEKASNLFWEQKKKRMHDSTRIQTGRQENEKRTNRDNIHRENDEIVLLELDIYIFKWYNRKIGVNATSYNHGIIVDRSVPHCHALIT